MNCDETLALLRDHCEGALPEAARVAVQRHLMACDGCRAAHRDEVRLLAMLRSQPVPPPRPGFLRQVLRQATRPARRPAPARWFAGGFASAAAVAALTWVWVSAVQPRGPLPVEPVIGMALDRVQRVGLVIRSPGDLEGVVVSLALPEGFELAGYPGRRHLTWTTRLTAGENILSLPIVAHRGGEDQLLVSLQHGDDTRTFRVRLGAAEQGTARGAAAG